MDKFLFIQSWHSSVERVKNLALKILSGCLFYIIKSMFIDIMLQDNKKSSSAKGQKTGEGEGEGKGESGGEPVASSAAKDWEEVVRKQEEQLTEMKVRR